ncbi:phage tail tape measure protein [Clostridium tagluense]|uniref:Phage tail tape measure protein domain-containing protein n=1 Tax=Clostridium tagluense TaxID=360422 RepID=A0A401UM34_9CLOT|nr:phage tail tape measure protein [Clostridium tagluense]GCD10594.1 hypothetical protein Ctaglu_22170 [Clostridium tagluense]
MSKAISTILNLRDNMSGGIIKVNKNVKNMSSEMKRASQQSAMFVNNAKKNFEKAGDKALKLGVIMATLATGFIIKVGFEGMKELDEASAKVKSIAGASLDKKVIKKGLLKTSSDTGISTTELGDTQYNAISSGVSSKDSLASAVTSAKLAKAGFTDSNSALKILCATMNVYGLSGQKAMQGISDKMLITQNLGVTTVAELAESMGSLTPIAKSTGLSIDELLSGMIGLTKNGIKTDEAVTAMKGVMTSIISPSKESADMAKELGINFSVAGLKSKGFVGFLEEIKKKTGGSTEKMAGLFGNVRALSGALVLAGGGLKDVKGGMDGMKNSAGATDTAFAVMSDTLGSKLNKLKVRTKNIATGIMDNTSGAIGKLASNIIDKLKVLEENGSIQKFVDKIANGVSNIIEFIGKVFQFLKDNKDTIINVAEAFFSFYVAIKIVKDLKIALDALKLAIVLVDGSLKITTLGWITLAIGGLTLALIYCIKHTKEVKEVFNNFKQMLIDNQDVIGGVSVVLGTIFAPALIKVGVEAGIAGFKMVTGFVASIILSGVEMVKNALIMTGTMIVAIVEYTAKLWLSGLAIIAQTALILAQKLGLISSTTALNLAILAQGAFNAIMLANPIVLVIAGLALLGIAIYEAVTHWKDICGWIEKAWNWLTKWNGTKAEDKNSTITTKLLYTKEDNFGLENPKKTTTPSKPKNIFNTMPKKASGTAYAQAGLTLMHEKGGEIRKASSGEMIIPADKSKKLIEKSSSGHVFNFNFNGNVGTDEFFTDVAEKVSDKILLTLANT